LLIQVAEGVAKLTLQAHLSLSLSLVGSSKSVS